MGGKRTGQGQRFHFAADFALDGASGGDLPDAAVSESQPASLAASETCAAKRILLAEDNETNQMLVTTLLRRRGYAVSVAHNGIEAVEISAREDFDIILMDMQMPVMDGMVATRKIRERERKCGTDRHIPIAALTANVLPKDIEDCLHAGMDAHVGKPLDVGELQLLLQVIPRVENDIRVNEKFTVWHLLPRDQKQNPSCQRRMARVLASSHRAVRFVLATTQVTLTHHPVISVQPQN
jgi:CheY-like chemotaxis protein